MRRLTVFLLALTLCLTIACEKKSDVVTEEALEPKAIPEETPEAPEGFAGPTVPWGAPIVLELTVFHEPTIFLTGKKPVVIFAPADRCWDFEKKTFTLDKPYFPLKIPFKISRECKAGPQVLRMGMRVTYAHKADETIKERNVLLEVPLNVQKVQRPRTAVRVPVEHFLELGEEIVAKELK